MEEFPLKDKTAIITGTNRGIGFSILETLSKQGCNIFAHAREKNEDFEKKIEVISKSTSRFIEPIYFDFKDSEKLRSEMFNLIKSKVRIDILVNCAGIIHGGINCVHFWSDCGPHFRAYRMQGTVAARFCQQFWFDFSWSFGGPQHFKSPVDGDSGINDSFSHSGEDNAAKKKSKLRSNIPI